MKKKNNLLIAFIALITLLSFDSCKKVQNDLAPVNKEKTTNSVLDHIKSLGFRDSDIKDIGDDYLVDGDILFSKKTVIPSPKNSNSKLSVNQYGTQSYIGLNTYVIIRVDPSMNGYINEINSAITQWNNIPNCRIKFAIATGSAYNTTITNNSNLSSNTCGAAYTPISGQPGNLIYIHNDVIANNSFDQRQRTITHELGHVLGLVHTNWRSASDPTGTGSTNIFGTPAGDEPSSLMNGGQCGFGATVLSGYDKAAVEYIYPQNVPAAGTVPVFRYYYGTGVDHFYTTDYNEVGAGNNNVYVFEGIGFFAFPNQVPGSVPVYRYYNDSVNDHFYTPNPNTPGGYTLERTAFYAYPSAQNGSVPIYRYYRGGSGLLIDHMYTKNQNEFYLDSRGYSLEDIHFYAY
jgi:hypothetical protein